MPLQTDWRARWRELYGFARALCGDPHRAEDLAQEAVWRYLRRYGDGPRDPEALRSLLFEIARNLHRDGHRRKSPPRAPTEPEALRSPGPAPEEAASAAEERLRVEAALTSLPPNWRAALFLADGLDWTAPEIARVLRTSAEVVRVTLHRARMRFRANLERAMAQAPSQEQRG